MDSDAVYSKLTPIFHAVFGDDSIVVRPQLSADDVDEWDSLSHIRLIMTVQKSFGVKFSAAEIGKLKAVRDLVELIVAKTA